MLDEEKKLLFGEYAAGRISPSEREKLFSAALEDQALFDAIAEEEEIRELSTRANVREMPRARRWKLLAMAGGALAATVLIGVFLWQQEPQRAEMEAPHPALASAPSEAFSKNARIADQTVPEAAPRTMSAPAAPVDEVKPMATREAAEPLYEIVKRLPNGQYVLAGAQETFRAGEQLQIRYVSTAAGRVELVNLATGQTMLTAPAKKGDIVKFAFRAVPGQMDLAVRAAPAAKAPQVRIVLNVAQD